MQKRLFEIMRRNRQKVADDLARLRMHDERLCALNLEAAFRGMPPPCDGASNYAECLRANVQFQENHVMAQIPPRVFKSL